ncbi:MAG: hypothetical protein EA369_04685 [Bradymonadales bacterium]|nr:MAG: hypothetical protein EA369_04685 [Bradymonadales bacterium]
MQITCSGCSSRYKLDDSKIKPTGTKVRCPKCSKTFLVHPKAPPEEKKEVRRPEPSPKPPPKAPIKQPPKQPTQASPKTAPTSPFKSPSATAQTGGKTGSQAITATPSLGGEDEDDPFNEKTIVSDRAALRQESLQQYSTQKQESKKPEASIVEEDPFATVASEREDFIPDSDDDPLDEATQLDPQAFKDPAPSPLFEDPAQKQKTPLRDPGQPEKEPEEIRPFGDATLLEIQRMGRKPRKLKRPLFIAAALLVFGYLAYAFLPQFLPTQRDRAFVTHTVLRPGGWYQHDPSLYQSVLTQIAALPRADQESPESRALLAESLILNGQLLGDSEQVLSGLGISTSLSVSFPHSPVGFYGASAYAIGTNDRRSIQELYDRWPESHRDDPEFELLKMLHLAHSGETDSALRLSKSLLEAQPDFVRGKVYSLLLVLQNPNSAHDIFEEDLRKSLEQDYRRHRSQIVNQVTQLPRVYQDIDRFLGFQRRPSAPSPPAPPEETAPSEEPTDDTDVRTLADFIVDTPTKEPPPNPFEQHAQGPRTSASGLPMASAELVAQAQRGQQSDREAQSLYRQGLQSFEQGRLDEALRLFRDTLKANAEYADAYKQIGRIYMQREEASRALRSFKIYLQLKPGSADRSQVEGWIESLE